MDTEIWIIHHFCLQWTTLPLMFLLMQQSYWVCGMHTNDGDVRETPSLRQSLHDDSSPSWILEHLWTPEEQKIMKLKKRLIETKGQQIIRKWKAESSNPPCTEHVTEAQYSLGMFRWKHTSLWLRIAGRREEPWNQLQFLPGSWPCLFQIQIPSLRYKLAPWPSWVLNTGLRGIYKSGLS